MKNITADKQAVLKAYENGSASVKKLLISLYGDIFEDKIKTLDDAFKKLNIDKDSFYKDRSKLTEHELSHSLLMLVCEVLNEGWTPNWNDHSELKYYPYLDMKTAGFGYDVYYYHWSCSVVSSRLCYKTQELAEYAATEFKDLYEKYFVIN